MVFKLEEISLTVLLFKIKLITCNQIASLPIFNVNVCFIELLQLQLLLYFVSLEVAPVRRVAVIEVTKSRRNWRQLCDRVVLHLLRNRIRGEVVERAVDPGRVVAGHDHLPRRRHRRIIRGTIVEVANVRREGVTAEQVMERIRKRRRPLHHQM